jgi:hypothetical protein
VVTLPGDVILEPVRNVQGFVLACLVDATTGMLLGSLQDRDDMYLPPAAAGAADVINTLSMMTGEMAAKGDLEDVIVTLESHYHLIRLLKRGPGRRLLLFVTVDRSQANLAMALREIRDFSAGLFTEHDGEALVTAVKQGFMADAEIAGDTRLGEQYLDAVDSGPGFAVQPGDVQALVTDEDQDGRGPDGVDGDIAASAPGQSFPERALACLAG